MLSGMSQQTALALADAVLALHVAAAAFIVFGLVAIPLGATRWPWVRVFWWRLLHVAAFGTVVVQKLWGETCFLTVWENRLLAAARESPRAVPLIHPWGERIIHVPLPMWFAAALYTGLWIWTLWLWRSVPPHLEKRRVRSR